MIQSRLETWLAVLRKQGGSHLYLVAGLPPSIRVHGSVRQLPESVLDGLLRPPNPSPAGTAR